MKRPFNITVSNDKMKCFLHVFYTGEQVDIKTVLNILQYNNIIIGVDRNSILKTIQDSYIQKKDAGPVIIARGDSSQPDRSENVEFHTRFPARELNQCIANHFKSPRVCSTEHVKKGSVVAERHVLDDTVMRMNIFGNIIKALSLSTGLNMSLNDKNQYVANIDGYVVIENASISVVPLKPLTVKIEISEDRLKSHVILEKNEFEDLIPSPDDVITTMKSAGVKNGIDRKLIEDELKKISSPDSVFPVTFTGAKGETKIDGEEAHINLFFSVNHENVNIPLSLMTYPEKETRGKIFKKDEKIAEIIKAKPGRNGFLVTGEVIKAKSPQKIELSFDFDVTTNEDSKENKVEYYTAIGGEVFLKGSKVFIKPYSDGYLDVQVSQDKLSAALDFYCPIGGGKPMSLDKCYAALKEQKINYGIDENKLKVVLSRLEKEKKHLKGIVGVRGDAPVNGKDGKLKLYFKPQSTTPAVDAFGNVDHYELGPIPFVEKNEVIAEMSLPTKGEPGKNIFSEEITPLAGKSVEIEAGQNAAISEDGKTITALVKGCPKISQGVIEIVEVYETIGDVNFSTGNIRFKGDVVVNGNVKSGFKVESLEGEVQIRGIVYGALIKAKKDIKAANGIVGERKCRINTDGNIIAKFIERAVVEVKGDVEVGNYILDSTVLAGRSIRAVTGRGLILGGQVFAAGDIEAITIGNLKGIKTYLYVGQRYDLIKKLGRLSKEKEKLDENLTKLHKVLERLGGIDDVKKTEGEKKHQIKMKEQQEKLIKRLNFLQNAIEDLNGKIETEKEKLEGRVLVKEKLFPGVFVYINEREFTQQSEIQAKIISFDKTKEIIVMQPFKKVKSI